MVSQHRQQLKPMALPLFKLAEETLKKLGKSEAQRKAVNNYLKTHAWPTLFLSVANLRNTLRHGNHSWTDEDNAVLMSLPQETGLSEEVTHEIFFPNRFSHECEERQKYLENDGYQIDERIHEGAMISYDQVLNDPVTFQELTDTCLLFRARSQALVAIKKNGTKKATKSSQVSHNALDKARKAFYFEGWPGRYRNLEIFRSIADNESVTAVSDDDANSLHALMNSLSNGISWAVMKMVFFPSVPEHDWASMKLAVVARRKWSKNDLDQLQVAIENDTLDAFAASHGRGIGEVQLKAQRSFIRKRAASPTDEDLLQEASDTSPHPQFKAIKRIRARKPPKAGSEDTTDSSDDATKAKKRAPLSVAAKSAPSKATPAKAAPAKAVPAKAVRAKAVPAKAASNKKPPNISEEMMKAVLTWYPSDAYHIIHHMVKSYSSDASSLQNLKGTYNERQCSKLYNTLIKSEWGDVILNNSLEEFQRRFTEAFKEDHFGSGQEDQRTTIAMQLSDSNSPSKVDEAQDPDSNRKSPHADIEGPTHKEAAPIRPRGLQLDFSSHQGIGLIPIGQYHPSYDSASRSQPLHPRTGITDMNSYDSRLGAPHGNFNWDRQSVLEYHRSEVAARHPVYPRPNQAVTGISATPQLPSMGGSQTVSAGYPSRSNDAMFGAYGNDRPLSTGQVPFAESAYDNYEEERIVLPPPQERRRDPDVERFLDPNVSPSEFMNYNRE